MPVLARFFEAAGMATIMVTNMPYWAEKIGVPRALGVEMPFGHILGKPGDAAGQHQIIREALTVLEQAEGPGTVIHSDVRWPGPEEEATHISHPQKPPPIMRQMGKHIGNFLRNLRRSEKKMSKPISIAIALTALMTANIACRPVVAIGWTELAIIVVLIIVLFAPLLFRLFRFLSQDKRIPRDDDE